MCHIPSICEEKDIPYIYTPSRMDLGASLGANRGSLMVLIKKHDDYLEHYDKVLNDINKIEK